MNFTTKYPELVDAEKMHLQHELTFDVPDILERLKLKRSTNVKVCAGGERFWVLLTHQLDKGWVGIVDNNLVCTDKHKLTLGDAIYLEIRHIYQIHL